MEQVEEICDHIVLMNLGKKILDGTVTDIKQQFKENNFLIQTDNEVTINSNPIFTTVSNTHNKILVKINEGYQSNDVLKYLLQENVNIVAYNELLPSLNDIFIKLVENTHATARAFQNN
jgi:ABC-2 type transport system ATP-binding protein